MGIPMLFSLPTELVHEILAIVQNADLCAFHTFRLCSHACKSMADSIFYKHIVLTDVKEFACTRRYFQEPLGVWLPEQSESWNDLVHYTEQLLGNPDQSVSKFVRDLAIGPFHKSACSISEDSLLELLDSLDTLQDFRWNTGCRIPSSILETIGRKFPHCRLHVTQLRRQDGRLDREMLSFPNLTSVDLAVLSKGDPGKEISEFGLLNSLLAAAANLECLSLQSATESHTYSPCGRVEDEELLANSALIPGPDWLTIPLQKCRIQALTFGGRLNFDYRPQHLGSWLLGMDCSSLNHLDIENSHHETILTSLRGKLPNLTTLKLGTPRYIYWEKPLPSTGDSLDKFLASTLKLRHLSVLTEHCPAWRPFMEIIYDRVGHNLHSFTAGQSVRLEGSFNIYWDNPDFEELVLRLPTLRELSLEIGTCHRLKQNGAYENGGNNYRTVLGTIPELCSKLQRLVRLHLAFTIRYSCSSEKCLFAPPERGNRHLNDDRLREIAESLFAACPSLEYVELVIALSDDLHTKWRVEARRKWDWAWDNSRFSVIIDFRPSYRRQFTDGGGKVDDMRWSDFH